MALAETVLRTSPQYWTAAVYNDTASGLIFKGWMPTAKVTWSKFLDRVMALPRNSRTMPYYWDGYRWVNDKTGNSAVFMRVSGETVDVRSSEKLVGALERRNPLPPGRYWQDIFLRQAKDWNAWFPAPLADGTLVVEKVERFTPDPWADGSWLPGGPTGDLNVIGDRTWVLFRITRPVAWPATKLGFPTIADQSVQASADTIQNPPVPTPVEEIRDALLDNVVKPALYIGGGYLVIKLLLGLRK